MKPSNFPAQQQLRGDTNGSQKSFDAYMWQTVERKSKFINQIMRGNLDMRTIEDIGQNSLDYAEITAIAADNPLLIEKTKLTTEVQRLTRLERAQDSEQQNLRIRIPQMRDGIETVRANIGSLSQLAERTQDVSGDKFTMTVRDQPYTERAKAGEAIVRWAQGTNFRSEPRTDRELGQIGSLAGHPIHATVISMVGSGQSPNNPRVHLHVPDSLEDHAVKINAADLGFTDHRIITSLEARITAIGRDAAGFDKQIPRRESELAEAESNLGQPFKHGHLLALTREQLADVDKRMTKTEEEPEKGSEGPTLDDPGPSGPGGGGEGPTAPQVLSGPSHGAAVPAHRQAWRQNPSRETAYER